MARVRFVRHPNNLVSEFLANGAWGRDTISELLDEQASRTPDNLFAHDADGRTFTYQEMATASQTFASALRYIGLDKGDIVAIQLPSGFDFLTAYFG